MLSIYHYVKLQLKQRIFATPIKSCIFYLSPVVFFIISWVIGKSLDLEKESDKKINLEFIFASSVALVLYLVLNYRITYEIISEKQKFRKQHIHTYGFCIFKFFIAWEIIYAILIFISSAIIMGCVYFMGLFPNINIIVAFLSFYLFQLSVVLISMFFSACFPRLPVIGGCFSVFIQLISVISFIVNVYLDNYTKGGEKFNQHNNMTSISNDIYEVRKAKLLGETINFSNLFNSGYINIFFNMLASLAAIIISILLSVLVDVFLVSIHVSKNSSDRHNKSYFINLIENKFRNDDTDLNPFYSEINNEGFFDWSEFKQLFKLHKPNENNRNEVKYDPDQLIILSNKGVAISIKHLFKQYTNMNMAISNVSFDIHDDEIFVITGPKNSGKSTLMKMLYGREPSSFGHIYYNESKEMLKMSYGNWRNLSRFLSVAPKEDYMFMEDLSVSDHIKFYQSMISSYEDGFALLKELNFKGNTSDSIKNLSEVEKNKVKIALALLKYQKYIFLEEPTAEMTEEDRECFWKAIRARSTNRVIVISTENVKEAAQNGNHILELNEGMIECIGDSEYIKNRISPPSTSEHKIDIKN